MYQQVALSICKIPPAVATSNAAGSTFVSKDGNITDMIIDI